MYLFLKSKFYYFNSLLFNDTYIFSFIPVGILSGDEMDKINSVLDRYRYIIVDSSGLHWNYILYSEGGKFHRGEFYVLFSSGVVPVKSGKEPLVLDISSILIHQGTFRDVEALLKGKVFCVEFKDYNFKGKPIHFVI